jgi:predicted PurR-regulated permease PerM
LVNGLADRQRSLGLAESTNMASVASLQTNRWLRWLEGTALVVAVLYFGRPILMPLALALLIAFALTPAVSILQRRGLHRLVAVGVVVGLIFSGAGLLAWKTVDQLSDLLINLPAYRQNLHEKIGDIKSGSKGGALESLERAVSDVQGELGSTAKNVQRAAGKLDGGAEREAPLAVRIVAEPVNPLATLPLAISALVEPVLGAGLVLVLVIFLLCAGEDIRNRVIRLAGIGRLTLTTRTLDELGTRISRYLLTNAIVNGGFGVVIGAGLFAIGVEYSVLWGCLEAVLRFLPYVGAVVASSLPIGMAVIQFPHWTEPLLTVGLFIAVELITNNVVEPLTYGKSGGVSAVALLVAAIFWGWIWGPIGLLLSVPLTVVLVVLGKYVPPLEPLWILLGDSPPLRCDALLYQRLLAGDAEEAAEIVEDFARDHSSVQICDRLLMPTLVMAERDRNVGELSAEQQEFVVTTIEHLIDEYVEAEASQGEEVDAAHERKLFVVGVPAVDRSDELALEMLRRVSPPHTEFKLVPIVTLASELIDMLSEASAQAVCISALGPGGVGQTRYLCKRIRQRSPEIRILVGRWGYQGDAAKMAAGLQARGASQVLMTLAEAVDALERIVPVNDHLVVAR